MNLRTATMADAPFLLGLRNDPSTLMQCCSTGEVTSEEHAGWLTRMLDPERLGAEALYVAEVEGRAVGTGSIRRWSQHLPFGETAVLSYTIASDERGNGLGTQLVKLLVAEAKRLGYRQVVCKIKRTNPESVTAAMLGGVDTIAFVS